ncbi:hypothetical protein EIL50_03105, partial [bacterium NHP-B]
MKKESQTWPLASVWEGVFASFEEAGGDKDAFESEIWLNKQKKKTLDAYDAYKNGTGFFPTTISKENPLSLLISCLLTK